MRTSYFGRINSNAYKKFADKCICISRTSKFWNGPSYPPLFPTWEMIKCEDEEKKYKDLVAKLERECKDYSLKFDIEVADNFISIRSIFFTY